MKASRPETPSVGSAAVILSDRTIAEELAAGRIVIEPLGEDAIQPSSVDLHVDRYFRVFRNDTTPFIDPKQPQEDLTELVEVVDGQAFILHPGEFVLGSTLERVALPDNLVARLEGKSSLGRLGLLIHSSLPSSEPVLLRSDGVTRTVSIGDIVRKKIEGDVVAFDPETFEISYHSITGWFEGPADRIFEVRLASGRRVRVTAAHNLFTMGADGELKRVRTAELARGTFVALPRAIPDPTSVTPTIGVLDLVPETDYDAVMLTGPSVARAFREQGALVRMLLKDQGLKHVDYYRARSRVPLRVARQVPDLWESLTTDDCLSWKQGKHTLPVRLSVDHDLAWLIGLYVAEGSKRTHQFTISNLDQCILDRVSEVLATLGLPVYRCDEKVTCSSRLAAELLGWLGVGDYAPSKRVPPILFGWPRTLIEDFFEGLVDGDGSRESFRTSVWTASPGLAADLLLLAPRMGYRAAVTSRTRRPSRLHQVYFALNEHKLLTAVPCPNELLSRIRRETQLTQNQAAALAGYKNGTDLNNFEQGYRRDAVRRSTLRRLDAGYSSLHPLPGSIDQLRRLVHGDLLWDRVVEVVDTGVWEPIYDLEVRPGRRPIENFLAGEGGVFVSNTAGFVDAGWDGHLTLELSNVATLPIAIYPGMKIGQISFLRMTTAAEHPYGSEIAGSKYQGQQGSTPSRYYLNFKKNEK